MSQQGPVAARQELGQVTAPRGGLKQKGKGRTRAGSGKPRNLGFGLGAVEFNVTGRRLVQTSKSWIHTDRRLLVAFRRRKLMVNMGDAQIPRREMPCLAACLRRQPVRGASPGIQKVQILMSRATGLRLATGILYGSSKSKWRRYECGLRLCKALPCKNRLRCKPSSRLLVRLAARLGTAGSGMEVLSLWMLRMWRYDTTLHRRKPTDTRYSCKNQVPD